MINYTEKGYGQHQAVVRAGYRLWEDENGWHSSNDVAVQAVLDGYTLDEVKKAKCLEISLKAKSMRDAVVATVSAGEMASWPIKRAEAEEYKLSGDPAKCPELSKESTRRGISLAALAARVLGNGEFFMNIETQIGGTDGKHRDAVNALTTFNEVLAYDYSSGWPAV
ncbi:MAG: hypothetical protein ACXW2U_08885 [Telluria sp.]